MVESTFFQSPIGTLSILSIKEGIVKITFENESRAKMDQWCKNNLDMGIIVGTDVTSQAKDQILNYKDAQSIIKSGDADLVAVGRGYLHNPRWIWKAASYYGEKIDIPSQYKRGYW